jgi:hypothetical protein
MENDMPDQEKGLVLVRVKRPGPEAAIANAYTRRRVGRLFEGEQLLHKVTDEQFGKLAEGSKQDAISESQLLEVMDDPFFHVEDPYVPKKSEPSKLDPRAEAVKKAREKGELGYVNPEKATGGPREPGPLKKK